MHIGLGEFRDAPTELWHSRCWTSSVRTTSGEYAHYSSDNTPIFPSDFISYRCVNTECRCSRPDKPHLHFGRVFGIGRYHKEDDLVPQGSIALEMQEAFRFKDLEEGQAEKFDPPMKIDELEVVLTWDWQNVHYIPEDHAVERFDVEMDYTFGEDKEKLPNLRPYQPGPHYFVRRQVNDINSEKIEVTPLCRVHTHRAEHELKEYGRGLYRDKWDISNGNKCMSVPVLTFIDGFGLYRNTQRSLMGIYNIIASMNVHDRHRRQNVLPITIGPHGSNLEDVILALQALIPLDEGVPLTINGIKTTVCVFTLAFIGDMVCVRQLLAMQVLAIC